MSSLAIAYAHTPWIETRQRSMAALMKQVDAERTSGGGFDVWDERCFNERMPNHVWSDLMWRWALGTKKTHALFLQDDVVLAPEFFAILHAMLAGARGYHVIALHAPIPRARDVFRENRARWVMSSDGLVGFAYVMSAAALEDFLGWKDSKLAPRACERTTEDSLIDAWALDTEIAIAHPVPTIVEHDTSMASTYGNDRQSERHPLVTWRDLDILPDPIDLTASETWDTPHVDVGRVFPKSHWVLRAVLADERRAQEIAMRHERAAFTASKWVYP